MTQAIAHALQCQNHGANGGATWRPQTSRFFFCFFLNISNWPCRECYDLKFCDVLCLYPFFPTCQVRVVRFYVSCLLLLLPRPPLVLLSSSSSPPRPPRPPCHPCRPLVVLVVLVVLLVLLLNCDSRSTVFAAGPQPRPSTPSVPCRTSTTAIHAQCSLPDLNHDQPRPVFPAGPQPRPSTPSVPCRTS